jgi:hypothetical protein
MKNQQWNETIWRFQILTHTRHTHTHIINHTSPCRWCSVFAWFGFCDVLTMHCCMQTHNLPCTIVCKHTTGHATDVVAGADLSKIDGIVCVSGDGLITEAVSGLLKVSLCTYVCMHTYIRKDATCWIMEAVSRLFKVHCVHMCMQTSAYSRIRTSTHFTKHTRSAKIQQV